jgi:hypothetical protein
MLSSTYDELGTIVGWASAAVVSMRYVRRRPCVECPDSKTPCPELQNGFSASSRSPSATALHIGISRIQWQEIAFTPAVAHSCNRGF